MGGGGDRLPKQVCGSSFCEAPEKLLAMRMGEQKRQAGFRRYEYDGKPAENSAVRKSTLLLQGYGL